MTDTPSPGDRLDDKLAELRTAFDDLRQELELHVEELGETVAQKIDAASIKVDELQAAWAERST